jgi:hypothetical protein
MCLWHRGRLAAFTPFFQGGFGKSGKIDTLFTYAIAGLCYRENSRDSGFFLTITHLSLWDA